MRAVVLVGGQGSRLRPITFDIPKALVPLRNRPFMGYMLDFLRRGGLSGAVLSLGYLPDPIQAYLGEKQDSRRGRLAPGFLETAVKNKGRV